MPHDKLEGWEGGSREKGHMYTYGWFMYTCGWFMLMYGRNQHNIVKQVLQLKTNKF